MEDLFSEQEKDSFWIMSDINNMVLIDGVSAGSWLARKANSDVSLNRQPYSYKTSQNSPVRHSSRFRLGDILQCAEAKGAKVTAGESLELKSLKRQIKTEIKKLESNLACLREQVSDLNKALPFGDIKSAMELLPATKSGGRSRLYTREEIVASATDWYNVCGVYFLLLKGEIVYIGQSVSVAARVSSHRSSKDFDSVAFVHCEEEFLDVLETLYILAYSPKLNGKPIMSLQQMYDIHTGKRGISLHPISYRRRRRKNKFLSQNTAATTHIRLEPK